MIKLNNSNNILTKIEENERTKEWKRKLLIRHQKVAFCFPFSSSSSIFFNGGLRESLKLSFEPTHSLRPETFSILKPKTSSNRKGIAWKTEVTHKTEVAGKGTGHHGRWKPPRSSRGGHWPGGSSSPLVWCVLPFACFAGCLFWAICIGLYGLVFFLSCLGLTSNHIFLIKLGPKLSNL